MKPVIGIVLGSDSDLGRMRPAWETLKQFEVGYEVVLASAHRDPERVAAFARSARARGILVLIGGAGMAAHLAGALAAHSSLPVIGVPLAGSALGGLDALYATVQMPRGIPVATVGVDQSQNAALLAVQILALSDDRLADRLDAYKQRLTADLRHKDDILQAEGPEAYLERSGRF